MEIRNDSGLFYVGENECLGFLMHFEGKGVYDAAHGRVDVSPEDAKQHNDVLSQMLIHGLDESCEIGQGGQFYWKHLQKNEYRISTWTGELVAVVNWPCGCVEFDRGTRRFRAEARSHQHEMVWIERIK